MYRRAGGWGWGSLATSEGVIPVEPRGCQKWGTAGRGGEGALKETAAPKTPEG